MATTTILFLAALPNETRRLPQGRELREIDERLNATHAAAVVVYRPAVQFADLEAHFVDHRPRIVHFSANLSAAGEILLEDGRGDAHPLRHDQLGELFRIAGREARCVVLSACYSSEQAEVIARHVDCVVGTTGALSDQAVISFSGSFYRALGAGRSVQTAFDLACNALDLQKLRLAPSAEPRLVPRRGVKPEDVHPLSPARAPEVAAVGRAPTAPLSAPPRFEGTFVGREAELRRLEVSFAGGAARAARVSIHGIGGVGKTALAMVFAERHHDMFPGGVLWANCGIRQDAEKVVGGVLDKWERELGRDGAPGRSLEAMRGSVRSLLAARTAACGRCLIVLDNVDDDEILALVRETFPDVDLLWTTRRAALGEGDGAVSIEVKGLSREASRAYFARTLPDGDARLASIDPVLDHLEDHALAVKILAEAMRAHPDLGPKEALGELQAASRQPTSGGALVHVPRSLQDCFRLSIARLPRGPHRPFLIAAAAQSGRSFPLAAAHHTAGVRDEPRAKGIVETLHRHGLLELSPGGRARIHRLLRDYLRAVHGRDGFGFFRPGWELPALPRILMTVAPSVSAGLVNYDARQEHWFSRHAQEHAGDEVALSREWPGIIAGIYRRIDAGALEGARRRLAGLSGLLRGADLSGLRLDRLVLDGACLDGARLERADLSGVPLRRWPARGEVWSGLFSMMSGVGARIFPVVLVVGVTVFVSHAVRFGFARLSLPLELLWPILLLALAPLVAEAFARFLLRGGAWFDGAPARTRRLLERSVVLGLYTPLAALAISAAVHRAPYSTDPRPGFFTALIAALVVLSVPNAVAWAAGSALASKLDHRSVGGLTRRLAQAAVMLLGGVPLFAVALSNVEALGVFMSVGLPFAILGAGESPEVGHPFYSVRTTYLCNASLRGANLRWAALRWVRLRDADLEDADLTGADLGDAVLAGAKLVSANLTDARLVGADLRRANLTGARLTGADLTGAQLEEACFDGAIHGPTTRWPEGFAPPPSPSARNIVPVAIAV